MTPKLWGFLKLVHIKTLQNKHKKSYYKKSFEDTTKLR